VTKNALENRLEKLERQLAQLESHSSNVLNQRLNHRTTVTSTIKVLQRKRNEVLSHIQYCETAAPRVLAQRQGPPFSDEPGKSLAGTGTNAIYGAISRELGNDISSPNTRVRISACVQGYGGYLFACESTYVTIYAGAASAPYSLDVPSAAGGDWLVYYREDSGRYLSEGYFSTSGTQWDSSLATSLSSGQDHAAINLTLLMGNTVSGTVSLPPGDLPSYIKDRDVFIDICDGGGTCAGGRVTIAKDATSAGYSFALIPEPGKTWKVKYHYEGNDYLGVGYYSESGTQWKESLATLLPSGQNHAAIDLILLAGNTVSGTVSLPAGDLPSFIKDRDVFISICDGEGTCAGGRVTIPKDATSTGYSFTVSPEPGKAWEVKYLYDGDDFLDVGYYSESGTQWKGSLATLLPSGLDHAAIDLTLLTGNTVSGTVSLPPGDVAPEWGIDLDLFLEPADCFEDCFFESSRITIEEGASSASYSIVVPKDLTGRFRIILGSFSYDQKYAWRSFYSTFGTQRAENLASELDFGRNHSGIDLTLLKNPSISGTISIPSGASAPESDLYFWVYAEAEQGGWNYYDASIPAGNRSTSYSLYVTPEVNGDYYLFYEVLSDGVYLEPGYYSSSGTQWDINLATALPSDHDHANINLTFLTGNTISGKVSLPAGATPPATGIWVGVTVEAVDGSYRNYGYVSIGSDGQPAAYSISVPADAHSACRVKYTLFSGGTYLYNGYFSHSGTQWRENQAAALSPNENHADIDLTLLTGNTVSGTVSLPTGDNAAEDIWLSVEAEAADGSYTSETTATIVEGASSASYEVAVPAAAEAEFTLHYRGSFYYNLPYLEKGYYSTSGTQWNGALATQLHPGQSNPEKNLTLLPKADNLHRVGGTVSGLEGSGLWLGFWSVNSGYAFLLVSANGSFAFEEQVANTDNYQVWVSSQPREPSQTCVIGNGTGTITGADITDIEVSCTVAPHTLGGTVIGLNGRGLVLQNSGGDDLPIDENGEYTFATQVLDGDAYAVTVLHQPTNLNQTCAVENGAGTIRSAEVANVNIICSTNRYSLGGTVAGLAGTGLVLTIGSQDVAIAGNGSFSFVDHIEDGTDYAVTVLNQPSRPNQTCVVGDGSGTVSGTDVTDIMVDCTTNTYTVGGSVVGLADDQSVTLANNGIDDVTITGENSFIFPAAIYDGTAYHVSIIQQPEDPENQCEVLRGSGILAGTDVDEVLVRCGYTFPWPLFIPVIIGSGELPQTR
jgi:hypothetical protein